MANEAKRDPVCEDSRDQGISQHQIRFSVLDLY